MCDSNIAVNMDILRFIWDFGQKSEGDLGGEE